MFKTNRTASISVTATVLLLSAFAFFMMLAPPCFAEDPVRLTAKTDVSEVTIGDAITYTVSAIYDKGYHVEFMPAGTNLGQFEIRDFQKKGPLKLEGGGFEEIYEYVIAVYDTGDYEIPPTQVSYWKREDEKDILETEKITITVKSVKGENAEDILDIKDPLDVRPNFIKYIALGAGALAVLVILIILLVRWRRKVRERRENEPDKPIRREPPHVIALRQLEAIDKKNLPAEGKIKEFYVEVSEVIRQYAEYRFDIATLERTTDEIMKDLRDTEIQGSQADSIENFLRDADMVKFAKYRPGMDACKDDMARARSIIENTMEKAA